MRKGLLIAGTIIAAITMCITTAAAEKTEGEWILEQTVDDFGDVTEDSETIVKTTVEGTFSNTATSNSPLTVVVNYVPSVKEFDFRLLEYNDTLATYFNNSNIVLKMKANDTITEFALYGAEPNGDLAISDLAYYTANVSTAAKQAETMDPIQGLNYLNSYYYDTSVDYEDSGSQHLYQYLNDEKTDVRCIIEIDNSKYNFTIPYEGFEEAHIEAYESKVYQAGKELMKNNEFLSAIIAFKAISEYEDASSLMDECIAAYLPQVLSLLTDMYNGDFSGSDTIQSFFDLVSKVSSYLSSEEILEFFNGTLLGLSYKPSTLEIDDIGDQPHIQFVEYECADSLQVETGVGNVADDGRYVYNKIREDRLEYFTDEIIVENGIRHGEFHQDFQFVKLNDNALLEILLLDKGPTPISILIKTDSVPTNAEEQDLIETIAKYTEEKQPDEDGENAASKEESDTSSVSVDKNVIISVQATLNEKGYDCGTPDGDKGPKTTSVIQQYQTDNGLEATGEIDDALLTSLGIQ